MFHYLCEAGDHLISNDIVNSFIRINGSCKITSNDDFKDLLILFETYFALKDIPHYHTDIDDDQ